MLRVKSSISGAVAAFIVPPRTSDPPADLPAGSHRRIWPHASFLLRLTKRRPDAYVCTARLATCGFPCRGCGAGRERTDLAGFLHLKILTASDANPPVDPTPATTMAAFAAHTGHIAMLLPRLFRGLLLRPFLGAPGDLRPSFVHALLVIIRNKSQREMMERYQRPAGRLAQPVLHI